MESPRFTVENIRKAIHQLYFDPNSSTKDVAQRWLMLAQRNKLAWQFSWELLQDSETEVQYFGASALVIKITSSWTEIPEEEIFPLRDRLYNEIFRLCLQHDKKIVLTRLSVAFAAFVIQCAVHEKWPTAVADIISYMQDDSHTNVPPMERCLALLEILTVLPEEYQTKSIEKYWRTIIKQVLLKGIDGVFALLQQLLDMEGIKEPQPKTLKCFASWIALGIPITRFEDLLHKVFACVHDESMFENSVECLLNTFCSPCIHQYPNTVKKFIPKIIELRPMLLRSIDEGDTDVCFGVTKVISGVAENQTKLILEHINDASIGIPLIQLVMECTSNKLQYPTEENASPITHTFWYTLQDDILAIDDDPNHTLQMQLIPLYFQLVEVLLKKGSYPAYDEFQSWTAEEKEQHRIFRIDISDALMYMMQILGSNIIGFMLHKLTQAAPNASEDNWQEIEAYLFGLHSVIESLVQWDTEVVCLSNLAQMLPTLQSTNLLLADTLLYTIGALAEWLAFYPEHIGQLLPVVLDCLNTPDLVLTAVLTLKRITRECAQDMLEYSQLILTTVSDLLMKGVLKNGELVWLMQSAGHVLSVLPAKPCLEQLRSILILHMHQLKALSEDQMCMPNKTSIMNILDILSSLFTTLDRRKFDEAKQITTQDDDEEQPVLLILQEMSGTVEQILNTWIGDYDVVKSVCNLYEKSIRNLVGAFSPLVHPLCDMLAKIFQTTPHLSVFDLIQQLTLVFGGDTEHKAVLALLIRSVIATMKQMYESGKAREHPDIAQEFMRSISHVMRKRLELLLELPHQMDNEQCIAAVDMSLLFHCGLATISFLDSESVKAATAFFIDLISLYPNHSDVAVVINQLGRNLMLELLKTIGGAAPRTVMDNISDTLFVLMKCNQMQSSAWFREVININEICANADKERKEMFVKQILLERHTKKKYKEIIKDFSLVCRGLYGTEYALG